jgi:hypothetical protein
VNGDSHAAAAEVVNSYAFAGDDPQLMHLGRLPHPENLVHSWGKLLSLALNAGFQCDAESAACNARIIRTTRKWLSENPNSQKLLIIQWSTWEREEWLIDGVYYQVNGSGIDIVPEDYQEKYREYIIGLDWAQKTQEAHDEIWRFHQELTAQNIPHVFFNGNNDFSRIQDRQDWGLTYIDPYNPAGTYHALLQDAGIQTASPKSYHYGRDGHTWWFRYMLKYITQNQFI